METASELPRVRRINGFKLPLGSMPYAELYTVYVYCQERAELAHAEADVIAQYMDDRFSTGPDEILE